MEFAQVIYRKCCEGILAACLEPECHEDSDWIKEVSRYSREGYKTGMIDVSEVKKLFCHIEGCVNAEAPKEDIKIIDPNQLELFTAQTP